MTTIKHNNIIHDFCGFVKRRSSLKQHRPDIVCPQIQPWVNFRICAKDFAALQLKISDYDRILFIIRKLASMCMIQCLENGI